MSYLVPVWYLIKGWYRSCFIPRDREGKSAQEEQWSAHEVLTAGWCTHWMSQQITVPVGHIREMEHAGREPQRALPRDRGGPEG